MHGIVGLRYCINWVSAEEQCLRYTGYDPLEKRFRDTILFFEKCIILNGWYIISIILNIHYLITKCTSNYVCKTFCTFFTYDSYQGPRHAS
jgi:hypothetical protein